MFYQGSLLEGISEAVAQRRLVLCFVTNGNPESQLWESDFLQDSSVILPHGSCLSQIHGRLGADFSRLQIRALICHDALVLRLEAGSESAGFLTSFLPLPKSPTVVILRHGELKDYIVAGTPREAFIQRVRKAFSRSPPPAPPSSSVTRLATTAESSSSVTPALTEESSLSTTAAEVETSSTSPTSAEAASSAAPAPEAGSYSVTPTLAAEAPSPVTPASTAGPSSSVTPVSVGSLSAIPAPVAGSSSGTPPTATPPPEAASSYHGHEIRQHLPERAAQMRTKKEETERRAKEERKKAWEKGKAEAEAGLNTSEAKSYRASQKAKILKQQQDAERERIMKRFKDDREEVRQLHAQRAQGRIDKSSMGPVAPPLVIASGTELSSTSDASATVSISVRLPNNRLIRARFMSTAPFRDVRQWVLENYTDSSAPCSLSHVLSPQFMRPIDETEDGETLAQLSLAPTATLILRFVSRYSTAYEDTSRYPANLFQRALVALLHFSHWLISLFSSGDTDASGQSLTSGRGGAKNHAADDPQGSQQLYNGNSLNFESRPDEEALKESME